VTEQSAPAVDDVEVDDLPEQMLVRRDKRARLLSDGPHPYPVTLPVTTTIDALRAEYGHLGIDETTGVNVGVSGRIMFIRNTGKLCFATLRTGTGETLQAVLPRLAAWPQAVDTATLGACFDDGPAVGAAAALVPLATARARQIMTDHLI
jgi:lysyl-tRNA synthetase class 2